jgi:hypothetical protein
MITGILSWNVEVTAFEVVVRIEKVLSHVPLASHSAPIGPRRQTTLTIRSNAHQIPEEDDLSRDAYVA